MPPLLTFIARLSDGLPLVANTAPPDFSSSSDGRMMITQDHKNQAKEILRGLGGTMSSNNTKKMSIDTTHSLVFHYLVRDMLCYLTLTESSYPKRLAFLYLEEISDLFIESLIVEYGDPGWRDHVMTVARPYAYLKFDMVVSRTRKNYIDVTSKQNTTKLNEDLADIQSIMRTNIHEILNRGERLEHVSSISQNLVAESKKFKWGAKKLGFWARVNQYGPWVAMILFVIFVLYLKFFF